MEIVEQYNKKIIKTLVVGLGILLFLLLILFFTIDIKKKITLPYNDYGTINYNVYLKENDFYEEKFLPKNSKYISSLIDYVDTEFDYRFSIQQTIDMKYSYYIDGTLVVNDKDGKSIYEKNYTLLEQKENQLSGNSFFIKEKLKIDYEKYNLAAKNFLSNYNISDDVNFIVRLHVNVNGKHENFENNLSDNGILELKIPIKNTLTAIEFENHELNNKNMLLKYKSTKIKNSFLFVIIVLFIIVDIIALIYKIVKIILSKDAQTKYNLKLNKIKKEYDRYMSETLITQDLDDMLRTKSLRIILVKTFEDLLDIRDNIKSPILFHEEIPNVETVFYIIHDNLAYIYLMHINRFNKKSDFFNKNKDLDMSDFPGLPTKKKIIELPKLKKKD